MFPQWQLIAGCGESSSKRATAVLTLQFLHIEGFARQGWSKVQGPQHISYAQTCHLRSLQHAQLAQAWPLVFHILYLLGLKKLKAHGDIITSGADAGSGSGGASTRVIASAQKTAPISNVPGGKSARSEAGQAQYDGDAIRPNDLSAKQTKEQIINRKMDPLTVIASFAADLDAASDWAFVYDLRHRSGSAAYPHIARMYKQRWRSPWLAS
ncbi:hypothetical protein JKP88DRAFT_241718 [Tribonema minus]|uniref:Uncharacterized protein n=1 Tax=Tribonema minus TaxID=303371 RepID=A0A836CB07_9STRA|nr:hypothetical protein JKP88DRAFT_241718 [Tribonema minus]